MYGSQRDRYAQAYHACCTQLPPYLPCTARRIRTRGRCAAADILAKHAAPRRVSFLHVLATRRGKLTEGGAAASPELQRAAKARLLRLVAENGAEGAAVSSASWLADPLRSWRDMALIVGSEWRLPLKLRPHYPQDPKPWDGKVRDERGRVVGEVTLSSG